MLYNRAYMRNAALCVTPVPCSCFFPIWVSQELGERHEISSGFRLRYAGLLLTDRVDVVHSSAEVLKIYTTIA
jgi:hypothetical protein